MVRSVNFSIVKCGFVDLRGAGASISSCTTSYTSCMGSMGAETFLVFLNFFKLHLAPTNSFREKLFLQEDTIANEKYFALYFIIKIISFGFPRIPHKETCV
jgi:hypothetical protein